MNNWNNGNPAMGWMGQGSLNFDGGMGRSGGNISNPFDQNRGQSSNPFQMTPAGMFGDSNFGSQNNDWMYNWMNSLITPGQTGGGQKNQQFGSPNPEMGLMTGADNRGQGNQFQGQMQQLHPVYNWLNQMFGQNQDQGMSMNFNPWNYGNQFRM